MPNYPLMYRLGMRPWERYAVAAAASVAAMLDREEAERSRPLGRALDLGCGRGRYTPALARRGWQAGGVDYVASAIRTARSAPLVRHGRRGFLRGVRVQVLPARLHRLELVVQLVAPRLADEQNPTAVVSTTRSSLGSAPSSGIRRQCGRLGRSNS